MIVNVPFAFVFLPHEVGDFLGSIHDGDDVEARAVVAYGQIADVEQFAC